MLNAMWDHFLNLLGRSWGVLMYATGSKTLGVILFCGLVPVATAILTGLWSYWFAKQEIKQSLWRATEAGVITVAAAAMAIIGAWLIAVIPAVYEDHQELAAKNAALSIEMGRVKGEIEWRNKHLSTKDPQFANVMAVMGAFRIYRIHLGNFSVPCTLYFTAHGSGEIEKQFYDFASVSNCAIFGGPAPDPDREKEAELGVVPERVVFHARKDDAAANQLFDSLNSLVQMKRSYDMPKPGLMIPAPGDNFIWFQFGPNVKWNSELSQ